MKNLNIHKIYRIVHHIASLAIFKISCPMSAFIQYLVLCNWILLLVSCLSISSILQQVSLFHFLIIVIYSPLYGYTTVFRHSPHDGSLDCVQTGAIGNNTAISNHAFMGSNLYHLNLPKATELVSLPKYIDRSVSQRQEHYSQSMMEL